MGITAQAAKRYPEAYAGDSSGLGFSSEGERNPFCLTAVKRMWMSLMVDAGMATKREQPKERKDKAHKELADEWTCEITPHYFRHNYITKLYYAGFDPVLAMWMVGHADYETTVNVYTQFEKPTPSKKDGGYGLDVRFEEGSQ